MATNNREMFTIDSSALDIEELEERLELATLFATNTGNRICDAQVAVNWGSGGGGGGGGGIC